MNFSFPPNVICCFIKPFSATKPSRLYLSLINMSCKTRNREDKIKTTWILDHFDSRCHFTSGGWEGGDQRTLWSHKYSATARRVTYKSPGVRVWFYRLICHHQTTNIYCFMSKRAAKSTFPASDWPVAIPALIGWGWCVEWTAVTCRIGRVPDASCPSGHY